jgi:hypothetical protein
MPTQHNIVAMLGPELIHDIGQAPAGVVLLGAAIQGEFGAESGIYGSRLGDTRRNSPAAARPPQHPVHTRVHVGLEVGRSAGFRSLDPRSCRCSAPDGQGADARVAGF